VFTTTPPRRHQRGQSLTEFAIALTVLVPVVLAVGYAAKYSDIQQTATQASRYAAMQRAIEPNTGRLSDATLRSQTQVRFFVDTLQLNGGKLQSDDSAAAVKKDEKQSAMWRDQRFGALLTSLDQVDVHWDAAGMGGGGTLKIAQGLINNKTYSTPNVARVDVSLLNRMDQSVKDPAALKIGATTAAVGNDWSANGNGDTLSTVRAAVPSSMLSALQPVLDVFTLIFEGPGHRFQMGCIKPDVVPGDRLEGASDSGGCH
jgi:hypothetical protein